MKPVAASPERSRRVAVFDIDGTVFRSSLLIELVNRLIERSLIPAEARQEYEDKETRWLDRKGDYESYIGAVVEVFGKRIKGVAFDEVSYIAGEIIEEKKGRVYRYTRDLVSDLKDQDYFLLAVSHSPRFIVDGFGYELGFDKVYGTFYATGPSERFTGEIEYKELIFDKAAVLKRAIQKENLTLEDSVGVGDTESDIPVLEMVHKAIAFNPNAKLYEHAKRRGWEIVVERKDVIYHI